MPATCHTENRKAPRTRNQNWYSNNAFFFLATVDAFFIQVFLHGFHQFFDLWQMQIRGVLNRVCFVPQWECRTEEEPMSQLLCLPCDSEPLPKNSRPKKQKLQERNESIHVK